MKEKLTIGKLAEAANVNIETIRFYERKELIKQPQKVGSFRTYSDDYVQRVIFIKRAQELGFSLAEIGELLALRIKKASKCSDVLERAEQKIAEIDLKIKDLKRMKKSLKGLADCCEDTSLPLSECPILDCF